MQFDGSGVGNEVAVQVDWLMRWTKRNHKQLEEANDWLGRNGKSANPLTAKLTTTVDLTITLFPAPKSNPHSSVHQLGGIANVSFAVSGVGEQMQHARTPKTLWTKDRRPPDHQGGLEALLHPWRR